LIAGEADGAGFRAAAESADFFSSRGDFQTTAVAAAAQPAKDNGMTKRMGMAISPLMFILKSPKRLAGKFLAEKRLARAGKRRWRARKAHVVVHGHRCLVTAYEEGL
jgi:hypothetical protein